MVVLIRQKYKYPLIMQRFTVCPNSFFLFVLLCAIIVVTCNLIETFSVE